MATAKVGLSGCIHLSKINNQTGTIGKKQKKPKNTSLHPHMHVSLSPDERQLTGVKEEMNGWSSEHL